MSSQSTPQLPAETSSSSASFSAQSVTSGGYSSFYSSPSVDQHHHLHHHHHSVSCFFNSNDNSQIQHHTTDAYARLLLYNQCYEAMPTSSKMVVLDTGLNLRKAFNGLIYQSTRHVLLAESSGEIVGLLSVTDFIRVMLRMHKLREKRVLETEEGKESETTEEKTEEDPKKSNTKQDAFTDGDNDIGTLTIAEYRKLVESEGNLMKLITIDGDLSLLEAARLLAEHRIHRLPVRDPETGMFLFVLTHKRLLKFLWCFGQQFSQPDYHIRSAKDLHVGTWSGIRVVFPDTPLPDCLDILLNKGVSGVPVVERSSYKVVDIYSRFDAVGIAFEERTNSLGVTVQEALAFKNALNKNSTDRVVSIRDTDTLWKAITVLVERNVHRLCAVNDNGGIEGIISLSDVINHMVVLPGKHLQPLKHVQRHYVHSHSGDLKDDELRHLLASSASILEETANGRLHSEFSQMSVQKP